jgi:putative ABC transport system permease protein
VGPTVANTLFADPAAALNQTVQINHVPFRVIGVLASYGQQEDNTAVVPLGTARRYIVGTGNTLNGITAQATQQATVPAAMTQLTRILDDRHHITDPQLRDFWRASPIPDSGPNKVRPEWRGMNARTAQEIHS